MILNEGHPHYMSLPGLSVLLGGMWVMNISYWGSNTLFRERSPPKALTRPRRGLRLPPSSSSYARHCCSAGYCDVCLEPRSLRPTKAYPSAMNLLPIGIKGLVFAALLAAIVSSLASMCNSISTIFTVDVAPSLGINSDGGARSVTLGRLVAMVAMGIAMVAAKPLLGNFEQAFQYIQEFTGFFTPGIVAIFMLGLFWSRTTATAALLSAVGSAALSLLLKLYWPDLPFMDRVGLVFILCVAM